MDTRLMCGRFTLRQELTEIVKYFALPNSVDFTPSYNITPSSSIPVVIQHEGRHLINCQWGLMPHWVKADNKFRPINARAETVKEKPFFRDAFRQKRCLIPASGYYEWTGTKGNKQPYYITLKDQELFAFAGLWSHWQTGDNMINSCTIITTTANEQTENIHPRMPVILPTSAYDTWLNKADASLLIPFNREMGVSPVSKKVNQPGADGVELIEPIFP